MSIITDLQRRVLGPSEPIDYSNIVIGNYPPAAIQTQPFVGFKVLCKDENANYAPPSVRMGQIDAMLPSLLYNTGCIMRETSVGMKDGLWMLTLPVPRGYVVNQITKLVDTLTKMDAALSVHPIGVVEISVSGKCPPMYLENCLQRLVIPQPYASMVQVPENTPYRYGHVTRINEEYMCFRVRFCMNNGTTMFTPQVLFEHLSLLSQLMCSMYN